MASMDWIGNAVKVKDVWTITVANTWATSDTATVTVNGKDLVITIGANVTTAQVATTIAQAWQSTTFTDTTAACIPQAGGTSIPEMSELTAVASGSTVVLTADTSGVPHTISVSETTAGSGTVSIAHTTTATGPNFWDNVDNWSGGAVPSSTDSVTIDRPVSILYGLDQNSVTLASLTITSRFTSEASIGLPRRNTLGYEEYRDKELRIGATTITSRASSPLIKINAGSVQAALSVYSTGTSSETNRPAFQFRGTHASNTVKVYGGDVGVGASSETATVATFTQESGTVTVGSGVTLTTFTKLSGTAAVACAATTLTNQAGTLTHTSGNITTLTVGSGTVTETGSGTITTLRQTGGDVSVSSTAAVTTLDKSGGSFVSYGTVGTVTNDGGSVVIHSGNVTGITIVNGSGAYNGSGTIDAIDVRNASTFSFDGANTSCTVTDATLAGTATVYNVTDRVTWTNPIVWRGVMRLSAS